MLERLGLTIDPDAEVGTLSRGTRTLVAVARSVWELDHMGRRPLLVADEPTAALSGSEASALWELLRRVTSIGGAALFVSHHLEEVRARCDRVTVLRDGRVALHASCQQATVEDLVEAMLGGAPEVERGAPGATPAVAARRVLDVVDVVDEVLNGVSFSVTQGEVVGLTGLLGMGQERVPALLAGTVKRRGGRVYVDGAEVPGGDTACSAASGIVAVPAERQREGLWLDATVSENLAVVDSRRFWRAGRYRHSSERARARDLIKAFDVRPREPERLVRELSGGNQQKVLLAKWLQLEPRVIALHEPTQGVDIAAKREIHRILRRFAVDRRAAVVIVCSDHEELAEHCDRVLVLRAGRVRGELASHELSPHSILELTTKL
jgi:ribose transport system ATP-binding protein